MDVKQNYNRWINSDVVPSEMKTILKKMNQNEIDDAFFKNVEFGTAGMRGILGPGTNRLNEFTVRKATVGFALYLLEKFKDAKERGVVIAHDNRHMSREFTLQCADTLSDFGIKTFIFDSLRPTPELSYAVRYVKAIGGIMITASHNPKEHNGYKVYDETGCQLIPEKIGRLVDIINELPDELSVKYKPVRPKGEVITLDKKIDDDYVKAVENIVLNPNLNKKGFKIVFTPNHGTSYVNAMRIFNDLGYEVYPVKKQCDPDPDFSGTLSPNPEDPRSFIEALKLAKKIDADLIVMTDPDGDRCGVGYKDAKGQYQTFTGNQSAALLMDYIFSMRKNQKTLSNNGVMYNTIVTSSLGEKIAASYGIKTEQFLTGFKYIGSRIDYYEKHGGPKFEFGYEESYGCLIAPFARDKDALQAITLYSEMALYYHLQGKTLDVVWDELGKRFGYHQDAVYSLSFEGSSGSQKMNNLMEKLHKNSFLKIGKSKVVHVEDYLKQFIYDDLGTREINLPKSDVVKMVFDNGNIITVRPSGTEPKVKFYIGVVSKKKPTKDVTKNLFDNVKKILGI